ETSSSGSSTSTVSPTDLSHWVIVPSVMGRPWSRINTSVASVDAAEAESSESEEDDYSAESESSYWEEDSSESSESEESEEPADSSSSPMIAMTEPTSMVSSSSALISSKVPDTGEGISVSTLSVETSSNGSSASTVSPTDFSHWVIVPSVTDSPSSGISTEYAMSNKTP